MAGHRGVDLRAEQDSVYAPEAGVVTFRGTVVDRPVITIDHGGGLRSSFEPVESSLAVGSAVSKGQLIGTVNTGHCALTLCVHWGVRQDDVYQDPMSFIVDQRPSVLLPLG
ncbi:M23 family metallopeptidase [Pseudarthrobacter sp. J1738]|uniref:M23 family metallopeptidase n=1 Tax=unclassified Pseudarthrobacter TaxID=2647000 RepID=UPI003D2C74BC